MPILGSGLLDPTSARPVSSPAAGPREPLPARRYAREDLPQVAQYLSVSFKLRPPCDVRGGAERRLWSAT